MSVDDGDDDDDNNADICKAHIVNSQTESEVAAVTCRWEVLVKY